MWGALVALFAKLFSTFLAPRASEAEVKSSELSAVTEDLKSNVVNEQALSVALAARVAVDDARIVRDPEAKLVDTNRADAINTDPNAHFRD